MCWKLFCVYSVYAIALYVYSYESGVLEDPAEPAPAEIFQMTLHPQRAPETPCKLQINFKHGIIEYSVEINAYTFLKIFYLFTVYLAGLSI